MKEDKKGDVKSHSDLEHKIYKKYLEEYNDLYPKIIQLSTNDFFQNLKKRVEISMKSKLNGINNPSLSKIEKFINEKIYTSEYKLALTIKRVIEKRNDEEKKSHVFKGEVIPHCEKDQDQKDGFYVHTCGEKFQVFKYKSSKSTETKFDYFLYCIKCDLIYKSNFINLKCNSTGLEFYTKLLSLDKENNQNSENAMPFVTWKKYHCNAVINDMIKCQVCNENLLLNKVNNLLLCKKCNKEINPNEMTYKCLICKENFKAEIKIYNPLEYKPLRICVKEAIVNRIRARPESLTCGCNYDISKTKFLHKTTCKGDLFIGILHTKKVVVCAKCDSLGLYEGYSWTCPICSERFKTKENNVINMKHSEIDKSPNRYIINQNNNDNSNVKIDNDKLKIENGGYCFTNIKEKNKNQEIGLNGFNSNNKIPRDSKYNNVDRNICKALFTDEKQKKNEKENLNPNDAKFSVAKIEFNNSKKTSEHKHSSSRVMYIEIDSAKKCERLRKLSSFCENPVITDSNISPSKNEHKIKRQASARIIKSCQKIDLLNNSNSSINKLAFEDKQKKINISKPNLIPLDSKNRKKFNNINNNENKETPAVKNEPFISNVKHIEVVSTGNASARRAISKENSTSNHVVFCRDNSSSNLKRANRKIKDFSEIEKSNKSNSKNKEFIKKEENNISKVDIPLDNVNSPKDSNVESKRDYFHFKVEDYKILKQIGQGSFGQILMVEDKDHQKYALKKLIANSNRDIKNIENEYQILIDTQKCTNNLNIVRLYGFFSKKLDQTTHAMYVLMELASTDWEKEILQRQKRRDYYPENVLMVILSDLIRTFSQLQKRKISHRDVKPQNILVFDNYLYKLADFGEAKELMKYDDITGKHTLRGTELYMSPILFYGLRSNKRIRYINHNTYKSDVFSFGLCALFAATLSFESLYDVRELKNNVSIKLVVEKYCLKRYSKILTNLICEMLDFNESTRKDFIELELEVRRLGY